METIEISIHQVKVYQFLKQSDKWLTASEIATGAGMVARTVRSHCLRMVRLGILDQTETFPAHHYRLSKLAEKRNIAYLQRLEQATKVFS